MTEVYSLSGDFSGGIDPYAFDQQIRDEPAITTTLLGVTTDEGTDEVLIYFVATISPPEKTALDNIVLNYVFTSPLGDNSRPSTLTMTRTSNTAFTVIGNYFFNSTGHTISGIVIGSYMDATATSYDVRIFDPITRDIIAQANFTNTVYSLQNLGTISNIPDTSTLLEIQIRKNGTSGSVYFNTVLFYL